MNRASCCNGIAPCVLTFCALVYIYLFGYTQLEKWRTRFHHRTYHNHVQVTGSQVNGSANVTLTAAFPNQSLFEVFKLNNLSMLQELESARDNFRFLQTPTALSWKAPVSWKGKDVHCSMLVVIKSDYKRVKERDDVRRSWGSLQYVDGVRVEVVFVIGRSEDRSEQLELLNENIRCGDILQVDQAETYHSIGLKALAAMQWVGRNAPDEWLYFSADDDIYPNIMVLLKDVRRLMEDADGKIPTGFPIICAYSYESRNIPERGDTKWTISRDIYPHDLYPPFCLGGFYGMSVRLASEIYEVSRHFPYYRMDDVFITGFMRLKFCDTFAPGSFTFNKTDKNCAISTKLNSDFKHNPRYVRLWKRQELAIRRESKEIIKSIPK